MMTTVGGWAALTVPVLPLRGSDRRLSSLLGFVTDADHADDASPTAMTVAVVASSSPRQLAAVAGGVAGLAVTDELIVVYGSDGHEAGNSVRHLVTEIRDLLPRHTIVTLDLGSRDRPLAREAALLDECLEIGSVPVVGTRTSDVPAVAAYLYYHLRVDRIVNVSCTATGGAQRQEVCRRPAVGSRPASRVGPSAPAVPHEWRYGT